MQTHCSVRICRRNIRTFIIKLFLACALFLLAFSCASYIHSTTTESPRTPPQSKPGLLEANEQDINANVLQTIHILDPDLEQLQGFLYCSIARRDLPAQASLHYATSLDEPRNACAKSREMSRITHRWNISELCSHLLAKKILLVGSQTTYILHDKLINILPSGGSGSQSGCPGAAMCTWHEVCLNVNRTSPTPPHTPLATRHKTPPHHLTNSAILRFALAMSLDPRSHATPVPYISPLTGVREHNADDWPEKARRSDLLILAKAPVPAPAWAYGNVSDSNFEVRMPFPESSAWLWTLPLLEVGTFDGIVGAAWRATVAKWLPELVRTLLFLSKNPTERRSQVVIWLGLKYLDEGCAWTKEKSPEETEELRLRWLLRSVQMTNKCVFHNAQVYMQNKLLKEILPYYNIFYVPKSNPAPPLKHPGHPIEMLQTPMTELPSPHEQQLIRSISDVQADENFLNGLVTVLRWQKVVNSRS